MLFNFKRKEKISEIREFLKILKVKVDDTHEIKVKRIKRGEYKIIVDGKDLSIIWKRELKEKKLKKFQRAEVNEALANVIVGEINRVLN